VGNAICTSIVTSELTFKRKKSTFYVAAGN